MRRVPPLLLAVLLACVAGCQRASSNTHGAPVTDQRLEDFKARIGFDAIPDKDAKSVVVALPDPRQLAPLADDEWEILDESTLLVASGEAERRWALALGPQRVILSIHLSSTGAATAKQRLLQVASTNMRVEIPYERGPADLGRLSVTSTAGQAPDDVIWVFHNACLRVIKIMAPKVDVLAVARALQEELARHVRDEPPMDAPRLAPLEVSAASIPVGDSVVVEGHLSSEGSPAKLLTQFQVPGETLQVVKASGMVATLQGRNPGQVELELRVVDPATLYSDFARAKLEVR